MKKGNILLFILVFLLLLSILTAGYFVYREMNPGNTTVLSWEKCVANKESKILQSYPGVCVFPDGRKITQIISEEEKVKVQPPISTLDEKTADAACTSKLENIFVDNNNDYAACLENGKYNVYRKTNNQYVGINEETGRFKDGDKEYISYTDSGNGSKVFKIVISNPLKSGIVANHLDVPDKENWINGTEYKVFFIVNNENWTLSPDKNIILMGVAPCYGCSANQTLYAYNFISKTMEKIGVPYSGQQGKFDISWVDGNTLKFREGKWQVKTEQEISEECKNDPLATNDWCIPPFPAKQIDLSYRLVNL
ncbi:MAG: hypothetical protein Q7S14_00335 [bacterium]|nr:hypothetical protein [bacterium]